MVVVSQCHDSCAVMLQILDWEQPVAEVQGKGHSAIPVYTLSPSQTTAEIREEENGRLQLVHVTKDHNVYTNCIPPCAESTRADVDSSKVPSSETIHHGVMILTTLTLSSPLLQSHKYILQATVLRDSWPMADSAWPYISMIKSVEKLDEGTTVSRQRIAFA